MSNYDFDGEPYVVIQREDAGIAPFLFGAAVGAVVALLFAPRSGEETRQILVDRARDTSDAVRDRVADVADDVVGHVGRVRDRVADQVGAARGAVRRQRRNVIDAIDAGRSAAYEARAELERKIAQNKAQRREAGPV